MNALLEQMLHVTLHISIFSAIYKHLFGKRGIEDYLFLSCALEKGSSCKRTVQATRLTAVKGTQCNQQTNPLHAHFKLSLNNSTQAEKNNVKK